ncbi:hypothetical protein KCU65_g3082, partial [Aureobasidium melanogenum]
MHSAFRILKDLDERPIQCKCLINGKFCTATISQEAFKAARKILRSPVFTDLDTRYYYEDDLRELARLSFCEDCAEKYYDQYEKYYQKLWKWMRKELDNPPVPEITIPKAKVYIPSGKADSDGFIIKLAKKAEDDQKSRNPKPPRPEPQNRKEQSNIRANEVRKSAGKVNDTEAEKAALNKQILDLTQQLEQQRKTAEQYLKAGDALYEMHEQLRRENTMEKAQWDAREKGLLMRIATLEQYNPQLRWSAKVTGMANFKERLKVARRRKVLHKKVSWSLGSCLEDEDNEDEL